MFRGGGLRGKLVGAFPFKYTERLFVQRGVNDEAFDVSNFCCIVSSRNGNPRDEHGATTQIWGIGHLRDNRGHHDGGCP